MWALISHGRVVSQTYRSREEADLALATSDLRGNPDIEVSEVTYCSSCWVAGGLIPVDMLDGIGCQRQGCGY